MAPMKQGRVAVLGLGVSLLWHAVALVRVPQHHTEPSAHSKLLANVQKDTRAAYQPALLHDSGLLDQPENIRSEALKETVKVLVYDTLDLSEDDHTPWDSIDLARAKYYYRTQLNDDSSFEAIHVGGKTKWEGWGSKIEQVLKVLDGMDEDELVVVTDARDVLFNPHYAGKAGAFAQRFRALTEGMSPEAVVFSAESQCCVSALTHALPGGLVRWDGGGAGPDEGVGEAEEAIKRPDRACASGGGGASGDHRKACPHLGKHFQEPWEEALAELAQDAAGCGGGGGGFPYPNAGLAAGRAGPLRRLWRALDLWPGEDDQAVLTDAALQLGPRRIVLDYGQALFGNNAWKLGPERGCLYEVDPATGGFRPRPGAPLAPARLLREGEEEEGWAAAAAAPAFLQFSGKFWSCYTRLVAGLPEVPALVLAGGAEGGEGTDREQRRLAGNYGNDSADDTVSCQAYANGTCGCPSVVGTGPYAMVEQYSGALLFGSTCPPVDDPNVMELSVQSLVELDADEQPAGNCSGTDPSAHQLVGLDDHMFAISGSQETTFEGLGVLSLNLSSAISLGGGQAANLTITLDLFLESGNYTIAHNTPYNETMFVDYGSLKVSLIVQNWDFCDDGEYLDLSFLVTGSDEPSEVDASTRREALFGSGSSRRRRAFAGAWDGRQDPPDDGNDQGDNTGIGIMYSFGSNTSLVLSEALYIDGEWTSMADGYPAYADDQFTVRLPRFEDHAYYDPDLSLGTTSTTSAPTAALSLAPTEPPSPNPTIAPTLAPTLVPTEQPTMQPSLVPTLAPTVAPTTQAPTQAPTLAPTRAPDAPPTAAPTLAPTPAAAELDVSVCVSASDNSSSDDVSSALTSALSEYVTALGLSLDGGDVTVELDSTSTVDGCERRRQLMGWPGHQPSVLRKEQQQQEDGWWWGRDLQGVATTVAPSSTNTSDNSTSAPTLVPTLAPTLAPTLTSTTLGTLTPTSAVLATPAPTSAGAAVTAAPSSASAGSSYSFEFKITGLTESQAQNISVSLEDDVADGTLHDALEEAGIDTEEVTGDSMVILRTSAPTAAPNTTAAPTAAGTAPTLEADVEGDLAGGSAGATWTWVLMGVVLGLAAVAAVLLCCRRARREWAMGKRGKEGGESSSCLPTVVWGRSGMEELRSAQKPQEPLMVSLDHPELQSVASMMRNQALIKKNPQQSQEQPVLQSVFPVMRNQALIKKLPPPQQLPLVVFDDDKVLEDRAGSLPRNAKLVPTGGGPPGYLVVPDQERYSFFTDDDGKSDEKSVFSEDFDGDSQQLPLALDHDKAPLENEGSSSPIPLPSNANQSAQNCSITDPADESPSEQGELGHSTASLQHGIRLQEPLVASEQQPEFQSVVPVSRNQTLIKKTPSQHLRRDENPSSSGCDERRSINQDGLRSSRIVSAAGDSSDEDSVEEY